MTDPLIDTPLQPRTETRGAPIQHGACSLEEQRNGRRAMAAETQAAVEERATEMIADGGRQSLIRDMAFCDLIVESTVAEVERRGGMFREDGRLLPVLERSLATFMNTKRLHFLALKDEEGRPKTDYPTCDRCGDRLADGPAYWKHRARCAVAAQDDAAPTSPEPSPAAAAQASGATGASE